MIAPETHIARALASGNTLGSVDAVEGAWADPVLRQLLIDALGPLMPQLQGRGARHALLIGLPAALHALVPPFDTEDEDAEPPDPLAAAAAARGTNAEGLCSLLCAARGIEYRAPGAHPALCLALCELCRARPLEMQAFLTFAARLWQLGPAMQRDFPCTYARAVPVVLAVQMLKLDHAMEDAWNTVLAR